jgi:hypothetical protein
VQFYKFKRYELNIIDKDVVDHGQSEDTCELDNVNVYLVHPLEFGGFMAFDPDCMYIYRKKLKTKIIQKKLRSQMKVKSICNMDTYNPVTKSTSDGSKLMRYLVATE